MRQQKFAIEGLRPQTHQETVHRGHKSSEKSNEFLISLHTIRLMFETSAVAPWWSDPSETFLCTADDKVTL